MNRLGNKRGWIGRSGLFASASVLLAIACGQSSRSSGSSSSGGEAIGAGTPSSSSSSSGGVSGSASGGSTGGTNDPSAAGASPSAGQAGASGGDVANTPAPGTCGVHRHIALTDVTTHVNFMPLDPMRRVDGGFSVGPWYEDSEKEGIGRAVWLRVDPDTVTSEAYSAEFNPGTVSAALYLLNIGDPNRIVQIGPNALQPHYEASFIESGGTELSPGMPLFDGDYGTGRFIKRAANVALDGRTGLFMAAQITGHPPRLAVFGADGSRVGDALETAGQGDCYLVSPTEHAGAFSLLEGGDFHLIEFSATGEVALDVRFPMLRAPRPPEQPPCPMLALTETGFAVLSFEPLDGVGSGSWYLHFIARDGTVTSEHWNTLQGRPRAFAVQRESVLAVSQDTDVGLVIKRTQGEDEIFSLPTYGNQIASEAGSLFLDVGFLHDSDGVTSLDRAIVEVSCSD